MPSYVGLDASKRLTSICVLNPRGEVLRETQVASTPKAIVGSLRGGGLRYALVGIEAGFVSEWMYEGLRRAGLPVVCIEARHAHGVLKARANKTDRSDAHGIADLMRTGTYQAVHVKSPESQRFRALITAR